MGGLLGDIREELRWGGGKGPWERRAGHYGEGGLLGDLREGLGGLGGGVSARGITVSRRGLLLGDLREGAPPYTGHYGNWEGALEEAWGGFWKGASIYMKH